MSCSEMQILSDVMERTRKPFDLSPPIAQADTKLTVMRRVKNVCQY